MRRRAHDRLAAGHPPDHDVQERADHAGRAARSRRRGTRSSAGDTTAAGARRTRGPSASVATGRTSRRRGRRSRRCRCRSRPAGTGSTPLCGLEHREAARPTSEREARITNGSPATVPDPHRDLTAARAALRRRRRPRAATARRPGSPRRRRRRSMSAARALTSRLRTSVCAARSFAPCRGPEERRDGDGQEDADDRDHHQQLDQREARARRRCAVVACRASMTRSLRERVRGGFPRPGRSSLSESARRLTSRPPFQPRRSGRAASALARRRRGRWRTPCRDPACCPGSRSTCRTWTPPP